MNGSKTKMFDGAVKVNVDSCLINVLWPWSPVANILLPIRTPPSEGITVLPVLVLIHDIFTKLELLYDTRHVNVTLSPLIKCCGVTSPDGASAASIKRYINKVLTT
jgi:hypothetical protein